MSSKTNPTKKKPAENIQSFQSWLSRMKKLYSLISLFAVLINVAFALIVEKEARTRFIDTVLTDRAFQFGVAILSILASFVSIFYFVQVIYRRRERQRQLLISELQARDSEFFTRLREGIHYLLQEGKIREQ
jgi:Co/Zn/Cd efflux system component